MAERRIDGGLIVSASAHAAVLLWTAISFAAKPLEMPPAESMPIDIISDVQFSQLTAGAKDAPKKPAPKPFAEKKAEPKLVEDTTAKVADKEIVTASAPAAAAEPPPAPPKPEKKLPEPKPKPAEAKAEPKAEPKEAEKPVPEEAKPDAEALKKAETKPPPKKKEAKAHPTSQKKPEPKPPVVADAKPTPPKKVAEPKPPTEPKPEEPKFNASRIAALLDKRAPQRLASAGDVVNPVSTLGARTGTAQTLSQNEIDALRARIQQCWNPPAGVAEAKDLVVQVRILFNQDGSLQSEPRVVGRGMTSAQQVAAESAMRAIRRCAPYSFMPAAKYEAWKDVEVTFDPRDLFRG